MQIAIYGRWPLLHSHFPKWSRFRKYPISTSLSGIWSLTTCSQSGSSLSMGSGVKAVEPRLSPVVRSQIHHTPMQPLPPRRVHISISSMIFSFAIVPPAYFITCSFVNISMARPTSLIERGRKVSLFVVSRSSTGHIFLISFESFHTAILLLLQRGNQRI